MRRVLILGLYYPPANFMAGRRLEGWAKHLPAFGYEPLVLTRFYHRLERHTHDFYAAGRPTRTLWRAEPLGERPRARQGARSGSLRVARPRPLVLAALVWRVR